MKSPAELAARLRKMVLAAQHHYSPSGEPLRSIVVSPEWLEDMADAANALKSIPAAQPLTGDDLIASHKAGWFRFMSLDALVGVVRWVEHNHGITQSRDSADPISHG
jgi:hypothetical protein